MSDNAKESIIWLCCTAIICLLVAQFPSCAREMNNYELAKERLKYTCGKESAS